jgi:hypothetical protein
MKERETISASFRSYSVLALILVTGNVPGAIAQDCPPNAHFDRVEIIGNVETTHCACNDGYKKRGGACVRDTNTRAANPTIMRALTRAECGRFAGKQLRKDLDACRPPLVECLISVGVRINAATCTVSALVAAGLIAGDPTKIGTVVLPSFEGALASCTREAYDAAEKCQPTWGTCKEAPLQAFKAAIAACPTK